MSPSGSDEMRCVPSAASVTLQVMDFMDGDDAVNFECVEVCPTNP